MDARVHRASSTCTPATLRATAAATWRRGFDGNPAFTPLEQRSWPHRGEQGRAVVLERVASMSFVASMDEEPRAELLAEISELLETHPDIRGRSDVAIPT